MRESVFVQTIEPKKRVNVNYRKILGDVLVVAAGALVALYVKEALAKAKTSPPATK